MTWQGVLQAIWIALNSPIGITAVVAAVAWALGRLFTARPEWAKFEGAIITAVRLAEKEIPDDTPNAALRRFDAALRYVLRVYMDVEGRVATAAQAEALKEGIRLIHNELDAEGVLGGKAE